MSKFFNVPINYRPNRNFTLVNNTRIPTTQISDNNYNTSTIGPTFEIDIHGNQAGVSTTINHIFVKCSPTTTGYTFSIPTGMGTGNTFTRTFVDTVINFEKTEVSTIINGFKHDLYEIPSSNPIDGTRVRLTFTGSDIKIYALMLLERKIELNANSKYTLIVPKKVDRRSGIHTTIDGSISKYSAPNSTRWKWEYDYGAIFHNGFSYDFMLEFMENTNNFVFAPEYNRWPDQVFLATWIDSEVQIPFLSRVKAAGYQMFFKIAES